MMHRFVRTIAVFSVVFGLGLTTTVSAATPADLSVSIKEQTSGPYAPGSIVTYRIRAFNEATSTASSYSVYTTVKASSVAPLIPVAPAAGSNCILSMPSQTFVCEYFRVDAGKAKFQDISFRVPDTLTSCPFAVSPKVQIASRLTPDLNATNDINKARPDTAIQCASQTNADLQVTQNIISILGEDVTIATVTVKNNGPAVAQGVKMTQAIPSGLALIPERSYPFCSEVNGSIQCNGTTMTVGQTMQFPIAYKTTLPCTPHSVTFLSQVSSLISDGITMNNQAQSFYGITCPVTPSQLTVTQKAMSSTDTVVKNQKNVNLLRFEARANEVADLLFTGTTFTAENLTNNGPTTSAQNTLINAQNYTLWVDTNNDTTVDTILQSGKSAQAGEVSFDNIIGGGYIIPKNQAVIFEVHADISASFNVSQPQLQLAFKTSSSFVLAAENASDGSSLFGNQIQLLTVPSTLYILRSQGDLYVTKATTPMKSHQLLGGTLSDDILRLTTHAEFEDIDVTTLVFSATGTNASSFTTDVDRLELYKVGATTPFAVATLVGCGSDSVPSYSMCAKMNNQEFTIEKGSDVQMIVRARMRYDVDGAVSGHQFAVSLNPALTQARGMTSFNTLSAPTGSTITSRTQTVVLSKIVSITSVDPNANGTAIPTGVKKAIGQFKFATAAHNNTKNGSNKFVLDGIIFTLNAQNVSIDSSSFKLYNKADPTVTSGCTLSSATTVTCANLKDSSINSFIESGSDATFVLEATIVNSKVLNSLPSILQVSVNNFENSMTSAFGTSAMESHLKWFDKDNASETSFLWVEYPETQVNGTQYQN